MRRRIAERTWLDGTDRLRLAEMYAGRPERGLVVRVEQRTTGAGRALLLTPEAVAELRDWLSEWLDSIGELRGQQGKAVYVAEKEA